MHSTQKTLIHTVASSLLNGGRGQAGELLDLLGEQDLQSVMTKPFDEERTIKVIELTRKNGFFPRTDDEASVYVKEASERLSCQDYLSFEIALPKAKSSDLLDHWAKFHLSVLENGSSWADGISKLIGRLLENDTTADTDEALLRALTSVAQTVNIPGSAETTDESVIATWLQGGPVPYWAAKAVCRRLADLSYTDLEQDYWEVFIYYLAPYVNDYWNEDTFSAISAASDDPVYKHHLQWVIGKWNRQLDKILDQQIANAYIKLKLSNGEHPDNIISSLQSEKRPRDRGDLATLMDIGGSPWAIRRVASHLAAMGYCPDNENIEKKLVFYWIDDNPRRRTKDALQDSFKGAPLSREAIEFAEKRISKLQGRSKDGFSQQLKKLVSTFTLLMDKEQPDLTDAGVAYFFVNYLRDKGIISDYKELKTGTIQNWRKRGNPPAWASKGIVSYLAEKDGWFFDDGTAWNAFIYYWLILNPTVTSYKDMLAKVKAMPNNEQTKAYFETHVSR